MKMEGSSILVESLKKEGVDVLFGITGGAIMPVYDKIYRDGEIRVISTKHEQGAAHAADGYARVTGKPGVAMTTSGPGATNLVTGIATAYMDSIPIIAITGQVKTDLIGNDAFQESDIIGITRPICKHSYLITDVNEIAQTVKEAFYIANTGRPGPVVIDFAKDIQFAEAEFKYPKKVDIRGYKPVLKGHPKQIERAVKLINKAKRPLVYAGGGIVTSEASEELRKFVSQTNIPTTVTLMGLGVFPETHPLSLGMPGMHGASCANMAFTETDLIIAIGARFDDRVTGHIEKFAPNAKIIHVDIDTTSIGKTVDVDIPIVGDAKQVLSEMNKLVDELEIGPWLNQIRAWKGDVLYQYERSDNAILPQRVVEEIYEVTEGNATIVADVGQNQMWAAQYYQYTNPRQFLNSGGLGTMGYSLPASIGAQIGRPDELIVNITGDGGFMMNIQELLTVASYNLPIKIAILNNNYLGMVRQWQELFFDRQYAFTDLHNNPHFAKLAEAFGVRGMRIEEAKEIRPALEEALDIDGPVVLEFLVKEEENVYPMVPAGAGLNQMITGLA